MGLPCGVWCVCMMGDGSMYLLPPLVWPRRSWEELMGVLSREEEEEGGGGGGAFAAAASASLPCSTHIPSCTTKWCTSQACTVFLHVPLC